MINKSKFYLLDIPSNFNAKILNYKNYKMSDDSETPLLLILSILQARNIPSISNNNFILDAKLASEILSTDPIPHNGPITGYEINSELAWQISKKSLHEHRLKRTPLKIIVFAHDVKTNSRTPMGHIILDLRSLPLPDTLKTLLKSEKATNIEDLDALQPKWYPILNHNYKNKESNKLVPAIFLKLHLESDDLAEVVQKSREAEQQKETKVANSLKKAPILSSQKNTGSTNKPPPKKFIQIGSSQKSNQEFFTLKIETSKITNILDLIRANAHIQIVNQAKLYVYMNLFGRDIKFPEFEVDDTRDGVEACSINIRANLHLLNKELINSPPLQWFRGLFFVIFFVFFLF